MKDLVSIAIPAFKSKFLATAIESVLSQTYKNFELIIVNDHSPEDITSIVESFEDKRICYYINEHNMGGNDPVANWNKCLSYAHGEFFCLLCDDDYYEPTFLDEMLRLSIKYPEVDVFRSKVKIVDVANRVIDYYPSSPEFEEMENYLYDKVSNYRRQTISEFMYRRISIVELGGYVHLPKAWCSDEMSCFLFSRKGGIASTNQPLVAFRMSGMNISDSGDKYVIEKVKAESLMSIMLEKLLVDTDPLMSHLIIKARFNLYRRKMANYLSDAKWKDFVFLFRHRKEREYLIETRCFLKALYLKSAKELKHRM